MSGDNHHVPRLFRILLLLLAIIVLFIAWAALQPAPIRPNLTIKLNGYTNDSSGNPLALISITNLSSTPVFAYMPQVLNEDDTQPTGYRNVPMPILPWNTKLPSGHSAVLLLPLPTNTAPWKFQLYVYNDLTPGHIVKRSLTFRRQMPFFITSAWFEPDAR